MRFAIARDTQIRAIAISATSLLVVSVLSIGQLNYQNRDGRPDIAIEESPNAPGESGSPTVPGPDGESPRSTRRPPRGDSSATPSETPSELATSGLEPGSGDTGSATTGTTTTGTTGGDTSGTSGSTGSATTGTTSTTTGSDTTGSSGSSTSGSSSTGTSGTNGSGTSSTSGTSTTGSSGSTEVPDFGLITQGVSDDHVLIGMDYNKSGCGDQEALVNQFGRAVLGDPEKSINTFKRYVNDNGGIRGRELQIVTIDDGGEQCSERHAAAAVEAVDEHGVFMEIVGIHPVGDLIIERGIPIHGGRSTRAEQLDRGVGQFQYFQDADGDFENWVSFGLNYLDGDSLKCLTHPNTPDFNNLETLLVDRAAEQGLAFHDIATYEDDVSTAQQQASSLAVRFKSKGCQEVWLVANNAIAFIFFTSAAEQQHSPASPFRPIWSWTARTYLVDSELLGNLMQQDQWENSIGLSTRIAPGEHPKEGNCQRIYESYNGKDGYETSASVQIACYQILISAEAMNRAIDLTGELTANSLQVGIDAIQNDFYADAHSPVTFSIPAPEGPFEFTGYDLQTVADWNSSQRVYEFPEYPIYWKRFGPGGSGGQDIRPLLTQEWEPPS